MCFSTCFPKLSLCEPHKALKGNHVLSSSCVTKRKPEGSLTCPRLQQSAGKKTSKSNCLTLTYFLMPMLYFLLNIKSDQINKHGNTEPLTAYSYERLNSQEEAKNANQKHRLNLHVATIDCKSLTSVLSYGSISHYDSYAPVYTQACKSHSAAADG